MDSAAERFLHSAMEGRNEELRCRFAPDLERQPTRGQVVLQ